MKLGLDLENCYGINQLVEELDFTKIDDIDGVCYLYAPNGTLKTSLAKTLKDIIFPERATKRLVTLDGQPVDTGQIMVINSYDESYSSKQISTLLVNDALKRDYDEALTPSWSRHHPTVSIMFYCMSFAMWQSIIIVKLFIA